MLKNFIERVKLKRKMIVVLGCSRLGATIASKASQEGSSVSIVDEDKLAFKKLDSSYSGYMIQGDATDKIILERAYIKEADEVVICTNDDNTNIFLACLIVNDYPDIKNIIIRLRDEDKKPLIDNERIKIITPNTLSMIIYDDIVKSELKGDK